MPVVAVLHSSAIEVHLYEEVNTLFPNETQVKHGQLAPLDGTTLYQLRRCQKPHALYINLSDVCSMTPT